MQFKVPQHIEMEDRIIGPLTMKQFVYLLVGGMITYATIKSGNITSILIIGVPVAILALCLAFIKVQDRPFSHFLFSLALYIAIPKQRTWHKEWQTEGKNISVVQKSQVKKTETHLEKHIEKSELEKLSFILDTKGEKAAQEMQEKADAPKLNNNFKRHESTATKTS